MLDGPDKYQAQEAKGRARIKDELKLNFGEYD